MSQLELITWARGTGLAWALALCAAGIVLRLAETLSLGRSVDLAPARQQRPGSGWRTVFTRSLPAPGMFRREPVGYVAGYLFHLGLLLTLLFSAAHIELFRALWGFAWPALPPALIDAVALVAIFSLLVLLAQRLTHPVKRLLSGFADYLAWAATLLPPLTGYLATHHLLLAYPLMLAVHILSAELLLVLLPFTKLFHGVSVFFSRWYNGNAFARKGVAS